MKQTKTAVFLEKFSGDGKFKKTKNPKMRTQSEPQLRDLHLVTDVTRPPNSIHLG